MNNSTTSSGQNIDFLNAGVDILVMNHLEKHEIHCLLPVLNLHIFPVISKVFLFSIHFTTIFYVAHLLVLVFFFYNPLHSYNTTADCNCIQSCSGTLFIIWSCRTRDNIIALASRQTPIQWLQIADCHINYFHIHNINRRGCTRRVNLMSWVIIIFVICNNESLDCWECKWALNLETKHEHAF